MVVEHYGLPVTPEGYLADFEARVEEIFPSCELLPGVERLLTHLHQHGVPMAVATSSSRSELYLHLLK